MKKNNSNQIQEKLKVHQIIQQMLSETYRDIAESVAEFRIGKEPLRIDFVMVLKDSALKDEKSFFYGDKKYIIIEMKPDKYKLTFDVLNKTLGYAHLYIAHRKKIEVNTFNTQILILVPEMTKKFIEDSKKLKCDFVELERGLWISNALAIEIKILETNKIEIRENIFPLLTTFITDKVRFYSIFESLMNKDRKDLLEYLIMLHPDYMEEIYMKRKIDLDSYIDYDAILRILSKEKLLSRLKPEDRLAGLKPEDRLAGLKPEEIRNYLEKLEKNKN